MIKDTIDNAEIYYSLSENLKKGFEWIKNSNIELLSDGRYEIDGNNVFASVQTYETKEDAKYEAHRKYIDIQYMIFGAEKIGIANLTSCKTVIEYNAEKDIEFYDIVEQDMFVGLKTGEFVVLYPHDAHKPSISFFDKQTVKKVVVKVAI
jgi:YhcH/YjgK/YiaL family protein